MDVESVAHAFGLQASPEVLPGGSRHTYRVGSVVLKHVTETSLENDHSPRLMAWIAAWSAQVEGAGFRFPRAIPTPEGHWITPDGWTAWTFVEGVHATRADVPHIIPAITAFHRALTRMLPQHPLMRGNQTPWGKADRWAWGTRPDHVHEKIRQHVEALYALCKPVASSPHQLIHGDLNPENILIASDQPPAFIDFSPFWRPVEFALGMFANWIGPRLGDSSVLAQFADVPFFDQMLIRASIRMLLVMGNLDDWDTSSEKRAAELVIRHVTRRSWEDHTVEGT